MPVLSALFVAAALARPTSDLTHAGGSENSALGVSRRSRAAAMRVTPTPSGETHPTDVARDAVLRPPMGWMSWELFRCSLANASLVTEELYDTQGALLAR